MFYKVWLGGELSWNDHNYEIKEGWVLLVFVVLCVCLNLPLNGCSSNSVIK